MNRMRQKIASRLKEAQNTNAMLTTFNELDMSAIMQVNNLINVSTFVFSGREATMGCLLHSATKYYNVFLFFSVTTIGDYPEF